MLAMLLRMLAEAPATDTELAQCAAIMLADEARRADGPWTEERALALAAGGYDVGRLEVWVAAHPVAFAPVSARQLVELAFTRLKPAEAQAKGPKCFETYLAAADIGHRHRPKHATDLD
jgi:hypothetical protein